MNRFRHFIKEAKKQQGNKESHSTIIGHMHENLVHYMLNGSKHPSADSAQEHENLKKELSPEEYSDSVKRAEHAANYVKKNIIKKSAVSHITRTSKKGVEGDTKQVNPSDVVVHFKNGKKLGLSLKNTTPKKWEKDKSVHLSNPGLGSIDRHLGLNTATIHNNAKNKVLNSKEGSKMQGMSQKDIKKHLADNPGLHTLVKKVSAKTTNGIADQISKRLDTVHSSDKANFIKTHVLRTGLSSHPILSVHTVGGVGGVRTSHIDHSHFDSVLADHKNIQHKLKGNTITFSHPIHGSVAKLRIKSKGSPALFSSIKGDATITMPPDTYKE